MGKGDQRTKRGKINRGTHGKTRPKPKKNEQKETPRKT
jgi:30S ribosomal protein S31